MIDQFGVMLHIMERTALAVLSCCFDYNEAEPAPVMRAIGLSLTLKTSGYQNMHVEGKAALKIKIDQLTYQTPLPPQGRAHGCFHVTTKALWDAKEEPLEWVEFYEDDLPRARMCAHNSAKLFQTPMMIWCSITGDDVVYVYPDRTEEWTP